MRKIDCYFYESYDMVEYCAFNGKCLTNISCNKCPCFIPMSEADKVIKDYITKDAIKRIKEAGE